ncbi:glycoside hydrolase superfamily [Chytriomyces cf. hyalinus JEL632]|nr:glycoside hydrolase superfamily [Chytriomyces cf. hyalinus JEL632]
MRTHLAALLFLAHRALSQDTGGIIAGVWLDDPDTPQAFNARMGLKMGSFQVATSIPYDLDAAGIIYNDPHTEKQYAYLSNVTRWTDGTNASVFMTAYADMRHPDGRRGMDLVTDESITRLAIRLNAISGRQVFLRWLPEMNGEWMLYGQKPVEYVALWIRMYGIFRATAPRVVLVWSPNLDIADPSYFPGEQYVDWVGCSVYFKGYGVNSLIDQSSAATTMSACYSYAQQYNKPFVLSETAAGWEIGSGVSKLSGATLVASNEVDHPTFTKSFWAGILNANVFAQFPLLRGFYIFEVAKQEEDFYRDYKVANDSAVTAAFLSLIPPVRQYLIFASDVAVTSATSVASSSSRATLSATLETAADTSAPVVTASPQSFTKTASASGFPSASGSAIFCVLAFFILQLQ